MFNLLYIHICIYMSMFNLLHNMYICSIYRRFESGAISSMIGNFTGGAEGAQQANGISARLAQRLKQPVFTSCAGVPEHILGFVEGLICKRLRDRASAGEV
jgi:hypothetical protein